MKLSNNFTLEEFLKSGTATRMGFTEQFNPPEEVVENLKKLCEKLLQPLRELLPVGYLRISSGYRCERLNAYVKGKKNSQHLTGMAADVEWIVDGEEKNKELLELLLSYHSEFGFEFDQAINEYGYSWIHISYNDGKNRNQTLEIK